MLSRNLSQLSCYEFTILLCRDVRLQILQSLHWTVIDKQHFIKDITADMVNSYVKLLRSRLFIEGLVQGNFTKAEAKSFESCLLDKLKCTAIPHSVLTEVDKIAFVSWKHVSSKTYLKQRSWRHTHFICIQPLKLVWQSNYLLLFSCVWVHFLKGRLTAVYRTWIQKTTTPSSQTIINMDQPPSMNQLSMSCSWWASINILFYSTPLLP